MKSKFLVLSIILNAILVIVLFFKPSLNEIFSNWINSLLSEKKRKKDVLVRLHTLFKKLPTTTFVLLINIAIMENTKDSDSQEALRLIKENLNKWSQINDEIESNELILPNDIRTLYRVFRDNVKQFGSEIVREGPNKQRLIEMSSEINNIINEMIEKLEKHIK